jgi:23S rRNA pseudouridine1911/1915/1917 synthase
MDSPRNRTIQLAADAARQRLDKFVAAALPDISRTEVQRLIRSGDIRVNGEIVKPSHHVEAGDRITVFLPPLPSEGVSPEHRPLVVLYEDADLVAIDKPAGLVVHPGAGDRSGTLVNAALAMWPEMRGVGGNERRSGIVHRLDRDTSGVMILARRPVAYAHLQRQFAGRTVYKRYVALVDGVPASSSGIIDAPIARDPHQRKRMSVLRGGRPASTRYDLLENLGGCALLSVEPRTGRTHQIRVHLAWLGYPIVGDPVYGHRRSSIAAPRLFLHAAELHIDSPSTGQRLRIASPLPPDLEEVLARLRHR